ncbi:MAG: OmpA family protein [Stenotrophomonas sp.]
MPGTYAVSYTATVTNAASGTVTNAVLGSGTDSPSCGNTCTTTTPVAMPLLVVSKASNPGSGSTVNIGDTITYTLNAAVENAALFSEVVLTDTPDKALSISNLSAGCVLGEGVLRCTLPASTQAGAYAFSYDATVLPTANGKVKNVVAASSADPVMPVPECMSCATEHNVNAPLIRLTKTVGNTDVSIGDLVRYALTIENVGSSDLVDGEVIDTPPAGFSYVEGSVVVDDGDKVGTVSGAAPLRIAGLDVAAGESATVVYVMRVGAGVRSGTHVNQAQVRSRDGTPVSNTATAEVTLSGDPMIDDSLLLGTVFNDRDGDGWQDSAELSQLHVQGGFAADAYVAGSTSVDRGNGHQPQADASAPLLHGLALGRISARQSVADPVEDHQLVIRQHLTRLAFTDDFVLRNAQGVTVRMAADGQTRSEVSGDAAKGLTAALPVVERRVAQVADGYVVDYVISNQGIDERGIPGVRIASVEGLLIESDQYGRYHLEGVDGGKWERGRNFILKVDATTLPAGSVFTTENPLLRRITPGIPVRFDFGVKLDESLLGGGTELAEMALGEVFFAPGNAEVRARYLPVVEAMAAKVRQYQRGEVVIEAGAESQSLAFERANAVKTALVERLEGVDTRHLQIHVRGSIDMGSGLVAGLDSEGVLLGTVLFDTDKADIRDEFGPLLDTVARALEAMGGGRVAIIGHTDVRASHAYNLALGMRRARAVHDALAARVSAETRAKLRVEAEREPQAQAGALK